MAKKQDFDKDIHLSSFDDLFQTDESREDLKRERLMEIPISLIHDFPDHPYKVKDDENMLELVESIKTRGLIQPVLVRPLDDGTYEMVSGHRRKRAFELANIEKIPARVQNLTKDEAILSMVDSNLQRDEILPSEKAFAFKMRLEAMKRQAGRPSKNNYSPVANNLPKTSSAELAEAVGESKDQIYRYIRLTTVKKINTDKQGVRTLGADAHKVKQLEKRTAKSASKIKEADKAVKAADKSVKTAKNTLKTSTDVAKKTAQAAKATVKVTVKAVKATSKAVVEAGKAIVAAVKELGALIVAGGVPAIVIVVVICLIGAIGGTCFGIFLANDETTGTQKTMSQAISELTSEHYANLTAMKASYTYDLIEIQGDTSINWKDVLAVYAIKTTSGENPLEVVTLDDEKMDLLRSIMKDMNKMTGVVTPKTVAETVVTTDEDGRQIKTKEYVTKQVLTVSVVQLSKEQIAQLYNFNDEQKAQLQELTSEEYDSLWDDLISNSGEIIQGDSDFVGTDMFSWPLSSNGTITSRFGTRVDPISGVVKTHGGTDIAAPEGTPILAAADGTVVAASYNDGGYGFYIKIKHDDTYSTLYGHCSVLHVTAGQTVKQGQLIAEVGSTGYSTGSHLHFEVIQNGVRVDALKFF